MDGNVRAKKERVVSVNNDHIANSIPFNSTSEAIAKIIIDKLISLAITQSFITNLEEKIPTECFDFTCRIVKGYLSCSFMQYERDDNKAAREKAEAFPNFSLEEIQVKDQTETEVINNEPSYQENLLDNQPLSFNNYFRGENDWSTIAEPASVEIDRFASSYVGIGKEGKQQSRKVSSEVAVVVNESKETPVVLKATGHYYGRQNKSKEKKKRKYSIEINPEDIPSEEFEFEEPFDLNINELRKEKDDELRKLEEEKKKVIIKQIESQEKIKETANIQKEYEKKKITVDANGKIVFIKQYPNEKLQSEFITAKTEHKDINRRKSITKESKMKDKAAKKEKSSTKNVIQLEQQLKGSPSVGKEDKKEAQTVNVNKDKKVTPVLHSTQGKDAKKKDLPANQQDPQLNSIAVLEKKMERGPIYPCGSCFDLIALEVGVSFTEEKKYKTGGKDYLKAFNKYSVENYSKQVKETVGTQLSNPAYRTTTDYNYTTNYNNLETYPSQFNYTSTSHDHQIKPYVTHSKMLMTNHSSLNPFMKTGRLNLPSLPSVMDSLDLTRGKYDYNDNKQPLPEDIFKSKMEKENSKVKQQLEPINKFTLSILSHDKWGMNDGRGQKPEVTSRIPFKPRKDLLGDLKNRHPHRNFKLTPLQSNFFSSMDNFAYSHNKKK